MWAYISNKYQKYIINNSSSQGTQRTQDVCTIFFLLRTTILWFINNNWIEYNSTRAPALYARLSLHYQHQLRWGNNPQQISICTINKSINRALTCAKEPVINLYHKKVHPTMYQVYTTHVSTNHKKLLINMYQHHQLYTSCMCQLINCLSQPWLVLD